MIWPLPEKKIRDFAASVTTLTVVEELDGFIETYVRELGLACIGKDVFPQMGEFSQNLVAGKIGLPVHTGKAPTQMADLKSGVMALRANTDVIPCI